jgi:hypothetical protein
MSAFSTSLETWQVIMEERHPGYNEQHGYKLPVRPPDDELPAHIRWGWAFEDAGIILSEEAMGEKITDRERAFAIDFDGKDCAEGIVTCHLDGIYDLGPIHEFKTTSEFMWRTKWGEPGTDRVTRDISIQCQHQMIATRKPLNIVSVLVFPDTPDNWEAEGLTVFQKQNINPIDLDSRDRCALPCAWFIKIGEKYVPTVGWARTLSQMGYFHQYRIPANPDLQQLMLKHYREWWEAYVLGETPPPAKSYPDIKRMIPNPCGTIIADEKLAQMLDEHKQIGNEESWAKKSRDALKVKMLTHAKGLIATQDEESADKWIFVDGKNKKLGSFDEKTFR